MEPKPFGCGFCEKIFTGPELLQEHIFEHYEIKLINQTVNIKNRMEKQNRRE